MFREYCKKDRKQTGQSQIGDSWSPTNISSRCLTKNIFGWESTIVVVIVAVMVEVLGLGAEVLGPRVEVKVGVVCGNIIPALVVRISVVGEPVLVRLVELLLPMFPVGPVVPVNSVVSWRFADVTGSLVTEMIVNNEH